MEENKQSIDFFIYLLHNQIQVILHLFQQESFRLYPVTFAGLLTLIAPLDFEVSHEYYLSVEGSRGKSSPSDITTVIINVTDVNDNTPVFGRGDYSAEVAEDLTPGALVMKVEMETHACVQFQIHRFCL